MWGPTVIQDSHYGSQMHPTIIVHINNVRVTMVTNQVSCKKIRMTPPAGRKPSGKLKWYSPPWGGQWSQGSGRLLPPPPSKQQITLQPTFHPLTLSGLFYANVHTYKHSACTTDVINCTYDIKRHLALRRLMDI